MTGNIVSTFYEREQTEGAKAAILWHGVVNCTFAELPERVGRYRAALRTLGVSRGDRVMIKADNCPEFVFTYLAVLAAGAIFVPMNPAYTAAEVALLIDDADPALLIHAEHTAMPSDLGEGVARVTLNADGSGTLASLVAASEADLSIENTVESDLAAILFTSGTTGRPKGAMLTHGNLRSNVQALYEAWAFSNNDVILHSLPLFHAHGLFVCLHLGLYSGATLRMLDKFNTLQVLGDFKNVSVFMGVPTFYSRLLESAELTGEAVAGLRLFVSGSAPLLPSAFNAFEERTGHRILERYGMTETVMITSNPYAQSGRMPGTVGFPLPGISVRVVDGDRNTQPVGEVGEIEMSGPNLCAGYWRRPDATAECFYSDGYFRTGDTGFVDIDGRLTIAGRSKDLIISGGFNVYPAEVEMLLAEVKGVQDVAIFGAPHPDFGEAVVAAITVTGTDFDIAVMQKLIAERLAKFKQPKQVYILDDLPRNAMGKILKQDLRDRYCDVFIQRA